MINATLTKSWVCSDRTMLIFFHAFFRIDFAFYIDTVYDNIFRIRNSEGKLVTSNSQLHRVTQRGHLYKSNFYPRDYPHIEKMMPQRPTSPHRDDSRSLSNFKFV